MPNVRVLVADDSALMRQTLRRIIEDTPGFECAGAARDGEDAVAKARELRPDVVTMDINMPKLDGISALQMILHERICPVVMLSSLTQKGALTTLECLELGAFDFVAKPDGTVSHQMGDVAEELIAKLRAAAAPRNARPALRSPRQALGSGRPGAGTGRLGSGPLAPSRPVAPRSEGAPRPARSPGGEPVAVALGISTGGPATLQEVLPLLPAGFPASIFLVQHMPPSFLGPFARRLDEQCALRVVEARAGQPAEPGVCYVAPGGLHLCPQRRSNGEIILRTPAEPITLFMPGVSVMMGAVRQAYGPRTIGVLMTGIGDDGADEMVAIRQAGGHTIAESPETAVVFGMPREAIERGGAAVVAPSHRVAAEIMAAVGRIR